MAKLGSTVASLARNSKLISEAMSAATGMTSAGTMPMGRASPLTRVPDFGPNPGDLAMFTYVPAALSAGPALVVVLHGCTQSAAGYDAGAGWSQLADRHGFVLLFPEQTRANNPQGCFNWFQPDDTRRGSGEALSIRQMIERAVADHGIDPSRIFVTGLSAGGAMAAVMLATYPDLFAGGAIIAGLPFGTASNVQEALASMSKIHPRLPREWGDLVRAASPHQGPWPKLSIWHGDADTVVRPANGAELVKQWTDLHHLPSRPTRRERVDGHLREIWCDASGRELVESLTIAGMGHGTPLAVGSGEMEGGSAGAFMLDVGLSSSHHIVRFWGLSDDRPTVKARNATPAAPVRPDKTAPLDGEVIAPGASRPADEPGFIGSILRSDQVPEEARKVIENAFKAAGLIKS